MSPVWLPARQCRPCSDAIDLWRIDLVGQAGDYELLGAEERQRFDRLVVPAKRRQRIAARAALRRILAHYLGSTPRELRFEYGEHGRPALVGSSLPFNLSHSREVAVVAVTERGLVGADVEWREPDRQLDALAERFFAPAEWKTYESLPSEQRSDAFYRTWCRKEAYLKAQGTGLSFSSRKFEVEMPKFDPAAGHGEPEVRRWLISTEMPGDLPARWRGFEVEPANEYVAAVFWTGEANRVRLFEGDFSEAVAVP